jgi:hypothetical protein
MLHSPRSFDASALRDQMDDSWATSSSAFAARARPSRSVFGDVVAEGGDVASLDGRVGCRAVRHVGVLRPTCPLRNGSRRAPRTGGPFETYWPTLVQAVMRCSARRWSAWSEAQISNGRDIFVEDRRDWPVSKLFDEHRGWNRRVLTLAKVLCSSPFRSVPIPLADIRRPCDGEI